MFNPESSPHSLQKDDLTELADQKCEHFRKVSHHMIQKLCMKQDFNKARPWFEAYHTRWPEDWTISCTYSNLLRMFYKEDKKAYEIAKEAVVFIPAPEKEALMKNYYDLSIGCMIATGNVDEAFAWSKKLDISDPEGRQLYLETLTFIANLSQKASHGQHPETQDPAILETRCKVSLAYLELESDENKHMINAASTSCLLGRNKDGVRLYRRALATPLDAAEKKRITKDLVLAMMQCPGGPMEDFVVMAVQDGQFVAAHKSLSDKLVLMPNFAEADGSMLHAVVSGDESVKLTMFPIPDPADLAAFGGADIPPE